jgi:hypothetical protein
MAAVIHQFARDCQFTITPENQVTIAWNDGHALEAVTGGAATYVEKHFFIACTDNGHGPVYSFPHQYKRLVSGNVNPKLAFIVSAFRQVACSINEIRLNHSEIAFYPEHQEVFEVAPEVTIMLRDHGLKVNSLLNQTMNILAATGINLMRDGHHYTATETLWAKLTEVCMIGDLCESLGLGDWESAIYHDTFHVYDMKTLATWVTQPVSPLTGKIASVVVIRTPVVPAGATSLNLILAMMEPIKVLSSSTYEAIRVLEEPIRELLDEVNASPLDYCASFPSVRTSENLKRIAFYDDFLVFLYGFLVNATKVAKTKNLSVLNAKSLKSKANQHMTTFIMGQRLANEIVSAETSTDELKEFLARLVKSKLTGKEESDESEQEE